MLAKLVDEKQARPGIRWSPVSCPPSSSADAETTAQVRVKHLICACTGLPRQDYEWLFQFQGVTPGGRARHLVDHAADQQVRRDVPVLQSARGAAGFVGGHVAFPELELGAAYDRAMQTRVFGPLGMTATTFDYAAALRGQSRHAAFARRRRQAGARGDGAQLLHHPGAAGRRGVEQRARHAAPTSAWSWPRAGCPTARRYISQGAAAGAPRAAGADREGRDLWHGAMVDTKYQVTVVHHGGDMVGFHSDMMWLPEHGVGAVVLTNGDPGWIVRDAVPAQAARGAVRRPARGRRRGRGAGKDATTSSSRPSGSCSPCRRTRRKRRSWPRTTRTKHSATSR